MIHAVCTYDSIQVFSWPQVNLIGSLKKTQVYIYIILCGDFNLPDSDWGTYEVVDQPQYPAKLTNCALDIIWDNFLTQVNDEPTRFDNILDLSVPENI